MSHLSQTRKKQKEGQPRGRAHLLSPIMDENTAPQYLFVVVSHKRKHEDPFFNPLAETPQKNNSEYFCSILQLETPQIKNPEYALNLASEQTKEIQVNGKEYVARFSQPQVGPSAIGWLFSSPSSSTEDLYIMPDCTLEDYYIHVGAPLHGFKFNISNRDIQPIIPPTASKLYGHAVNREGHIYFMAHPDSYYETPDPVFECYDPVENKWKAIEPFPDHDVRAPRRSIAATAVWGDTILYNMGGCEIWAYNGHTNKWCTVKVVGNRCYNIVGEAVVLENTIYALSDPDVSLNSVLALSIEREEIDGVYELKCSLLSEILVPGMDQIKFDDTEAFQKTRHLVHLGKDNFCLVQSCNFPGLNRYQPIQLTSIKLTRDWSGKRSMTVMGVCVYVVEIYSDMQSQSIIQGDEQQQVNYVFDYGEDKEITYFLDGPGSEQEHDQQFEVRVCFYPPEYKTASLKLGETPSFDLNPFPVDYASKNKDKTEGNCICVRNVPPDATFAELESDTQCRFGCIQRMQVVMNNTGNPFAYVEFESEAGKRRALKESSIMIGDGLSLVDCHKTISSSSSGENKFKNHGEVSQSKTICGGHSVKGGGGGHKLPSRCSERSLFVVVSWDEMAPCSISILQLDTQNTNRESAARSIKRSKKKNMNREPRLLFSDIETQLSQKEYVAHLSRPQGSAVVQWALTSCSEKLYMLPYWDFSDHKIHFAMHGCIFDLKTKTIRPSKPPNANKFAGHVVSLDGFIYFLAQPSLGRFNLHPAFERYHPASDEWETLEPFPFHMVPAHCADITATIVWNNTILYNMCGWAIWAYDVKNKKWYHVIVKDSRCLRIEGETVVVKNTIYALAIVPSDVILALSIERKGIGDDVVFKCSIRSSIQVPKMDQISFGGLRNDLAGSLLITRHLVHLGKDNFWLVHCCKPKDGYQPIQITKLKLEGEKLMTVTDVRAHYLQIPGDHHFKVEHCFSLSEHETTALNTGGRLFYFDPYPADFEKGHFSICKQIRSHVYAIPSFARKASTLGDGHFICLINLPSAATFRQIQKELKEFGLIKEEGIQFEIDDKGSWSAIVEFESETSKQNAIKASPIIINSCSVEIEEMRRDFEREGAVCGNWGTPYDDDNEGEKIVDAEKQSGQEADEDAKKDSPVTESSDEPLEYEKGIEEKRKALQSGKSEERMVDLDNKEFTSFEEYEMVLEEKRKALLSGRAEVRMADLYNKEFLDLYEEMIKALRRVKDKRMDKRKESKELAIDEANNSVSITENLKPETW